MLTRHEILNWLRETDAERLETLWRQADGVRRAHVGDAVHLRGLIEISNICVRRCGYCGLRAPNLAIERYRMTPDEILACARQAVGFGYGTVVLQAGEDPRLTRELVSEIVRRIKRETDLAVTLSLGERTTDELAAWKNAGADRYLLRFETSNRRLFDEIHPPRPGAASDRLAQLRALRGLGFEVGSGVMIGIPGQSYDDLASDLELFRDLDLDMIGCGPFLPHPATPLGAIQNPDREGGHDPRPDRQGGHDPRPDRQGGRDPIPDRQGGRDRRPDRKGGHIHNPDHKGGAFAAVAGRNGSEVTPRVPGRGAASADKAAYLGTRDQVPNTELMTYKVIAVARLLCPRANIPSTTALATLNRAQGRELGLMRGANIVMPNLTPPPYRARYEIYPAKACLLEDAQECHERLRRRIESIGRTIGDGRGDSPNWRARVQTSE